MHNFKHTRAIHNVSHIWTECHLRGLEGSDSTGAYCASGASKFGHFSQPVRSLCIQLRQFKAFVCSVRNNIVKCLVQVKSQVNKFQDLRVHIDFAGPLEINYVYYSKLDRR